jgi:hypothetical protein
MNSKICLPKDEIKIDTCLPNGEKVYKFSIEDMTPKECDFESPYSYYGEKLTFFETLQDLHRLERLQKRTDELLTVMAEKGLFKESETLRFLADEVRLNIER